VRISKVRTYFGGFPARWREARWEMVGRVRSASNHIPVGRIRGPNTAGMGIHELVEHFTH
jgi:hypothetical protein